MDTDELLELYGNKEYAGAELLYHANSDFIKLVD